MNSTVKITAPTKVKRARALLLPDPLKELEDLVAKAKGASATEAARISNLLANKQEEYEIDSTANPQDSEKAALADAALAALFKVRKAKPSSADADSSDPE
jgi:hypothetical protein